MKKLVAFTTAILAILLIVLGVIMLKNSGIKLNGSQGKTKQTADAESEEIIPEEYYEGNLLRTTVPKAKLTYEGKDFSVTIVNPFYEEEGENYINVVFYNETHGIILESLGKGDDSEFFNVYRTEDGGESWTVCNGEVWFKLEADNHLEMISETEVLFITKYENEVLDTTITTIKYSPDMGQTWYEYTPESGTANSEAVVTLLNSLSTEEKVAMLFMVSPQAFAGSSSYAGDAKNLLGKYPVSGILFSADNIDYASQFEELVTNYANYGNEAEKLPIFLAISEEGGDAAVLSGNSTLSEEENVIPAISSLSRTSSAETAESVGSQIGQIVSKYGLNMDLAPVSDVLGGNSNQMSTRVAGTDASTVSEVANGIKKGIENEGVISVMKYFPGYGAASDNSEGFPIINSTASSMMNKEFLPYINAISEGVSAIMVGHITVPEITGNDTPSSLSKGMITDTLREKLGFKGVIMTDSLSDGKITEKYTADEAAVNAILAGADMIVDPADFELAYTGLLEAVNKGTISSDRLDQSVYRILCLRSTLVKD